ncbi:cysteine proteinase, partial [Fistulina hepatica ATCC 64428]
PTCGICSVCIPRPFMCLHCRYTGCWNHEHIISHLRSSGHAFCMDPRSGALFCSACEDFVYHPQLDTLYLNTCVAAEESQNFFQVERTRRQQYLPWISGATVDFSNTTPMPCYMNRGLLNLGQTCFLNSVLQSLLHNPLLRNYFLADKHNHCSCRIEDCTCCELDKLFTEVYSDDRTPYGPTTFLTLTWRKSNDMCGYAQQDAHESFISILNHMHSNSRGSTNVSCNCIVHSTFAGQLQSEVKCGRCGNVTVTVDPILDISLELSGSNEDTLSSCLRRFTHPERLASEEYTCQQCGKSSHESSKRMSIRRLPPVLSFQFKRFEQKSSDKATTQKIDSFVRFPSVLNMAPYTRNAMKDETDSDVPPLGVLGPMYEYDLFAVINHEGQLNNGHYTNYARSQDEWYRFDDDKVTCSSLTACLESAAYMCFYVRRHLEYKPKITPTYRRVHQENETKAAEREREAERERARQAEIEKAKEEEAALYQREKEVEDELLATVF